MNITYNNVFYFGKDKKNLHFINLVIDNKSYGDLVIAINTDLGAQLNNFCLEKEQVIEVEYIGSDFDILELSTNDIAQSVKESVYNFFDTTAKIKGFINSNDCVFVLSSSDKLKAENAKIFLEWRNKNLSVLDELITNIDKIDKFSIDYVLEHFTPIEWAKSADEKTLDELKSDKLAELSTKASSFEQIENKEMYIISSLGYKVNADPKALRNIEVLIDLGVTQFRNYDNENVEVTTDNLKTIKSEIGINSVKLYQQKWAMQDLINKAETIEELNSIEIKFTMMDFTNE